MPDRCNSIDYTTAGHELCAINISILATAPMCIVHRRVIGIIGAINGRFVGLQHLRGGPLVVPAGDGK